MKNELRSSEETDILGVEYHVQMLEMSFPVSAHRTWSILDNTTLRKKVHGVHSVQLSAIMEVLELTHSIRVYSKCSFANIQSPLGRPLTGSSQNRKMMIVVRMYL